MGRSSARRIPAWVQEPIRQCLDAIQRLLDVVRLSARGIAMLRGMPNLLEALELLSDEADDQEAADVEAAKREAKLAEREVDTGFPVLHAWAVVGLWTLLEAMVRDLVATWLKRKPTAWRCECVAGLRVRIGEYQAVPEYQRHAFVADLLERELGAGLRAGVARFETLLEPFGLAGAIPKRLRREIFELGQVRNALVHRAGKVDRQLLDACPWLDHKIGDDLHVTGPTLLSYQGAAIAYVKLIICRLGVVYGRVMTDATAEIFSEYED